MSGTFIEIVWLSVGSLLGLAVAVLARTEISARRRGRRQHQWNRTVQLGTEALQRLRRDPHDDVAADHLTAAFRQAHTPLNIVRLADILVGDRSNEPHVTAALDAAGVPQRIAGYLRTTNASAAADALRLAGLTGSPRLRSAVQARIVDDHPEVRRAAHAALAQLDPTTAFALLSDRLHDPEPWVVQQMAALTRRQPGTAKAPIRATTLRQRPNLLPQLTEMAVDQPEAVRLAAIEIIGAMNDNRADEVLAAAVQANNGVTARSAARALSDSRAGRRLLEHIAASQDASALVARSALERSATSDTESVG